MLGARFRAIRLATAALAFFVLAPRPSHAISDEEFARLRAGEVVVRPRMVDVGSARYIGGVAYALVGAGPAALRSILRETKSYERLVPRVKQVSLVGENEGDRFLRVVHSIFDASYTVRVHEEPKEFQFWVDQQKAHDVDDAWGFLHYEAFDFPAPAPPAPCGERVLVTYAIMIRLSPGIVRELFSDRLRAAALSLPRRLQRFAGEQVCQPAPR